MHLIEVDDIGAQPLEACLAGADQMPAGKAAIVGTLPHRKARLGRDQHAGLALAAHRLANQFLRPAAGIDVGGVDHVDACIGDEIDQPPHFVQADVADLREVAPAAESHRAHRQDRNFQPRTAQ